MNIKTTLFTLVISSIFCLSALPVLADAFRNTRDKYEESIQRNQQGDRDEEQNRTQKSGKDRIDKPRRDEPRHEKSRRDRDDDHARDQKLDREKLRSVDRPPVKRFEKDRHDRPVKRVENDRHDRPATVRDNNRYERPPSGLYERVKRQAQPVAKVKRPKHRIDYRNHSHRKYRYIRGPWYYTRYISPFPRHYHPIGFRLDVLPRPYVRIYIGGLPYYYYSGVYYRPYRSSYIVVSAPIGAFVSSLPEGFIAFTLGLATYYYVNDTYYLWDENRTGYVVVEKPDGAAEAIAKVTSERLVAYPNKGQSEEQQAKDRYECHRWAVTESGFDPTLEEDEYSSEDNDLYRRAIAACLEGRNYTVK